MNPEKEASKYCNDSVEERIDSLEKQVKALQGARFKHENRIKALEESDSPELTDVEKRILTMLSDKYEWVAKDPEDNTACVYESKPYLNEEGLEWEDDEGTFVTVTIYQNDTATFNSLSTDRPYRIKELIEEG